MLDDNDYSYEELKQRRRGIPNLTWGALLGDNKGELPECAKCSEIDIHHRSSMYSSYSETSVKMQYVQAEPNSWDQEDCLICKKCGNKITVSQWEKQKEEARKKVEQKYENQKISMSWDNSNTNRPLIISKLDDRTGRYYHVPSTIYDDINEEVIKEIEKATGTRVARLTDYDVFKK